MIEVIKTSLFILTLGASNEIYDKLCPIINKTLSK